MKKLLILLAGFGLLATSGIASAAGNANPFNIPGHNNPTLRFFKKTPLPAFQAAPWYTYFPYNSHFQMPAPLPGQDVPGPGGFGAGQGWMNPYFPTSPNK